MNKEIKQLERRLQYRTIIKKCESNYQHMNKTDTNHICIINFLLLPHRASYVIINHHPVKYLKGRNNFYN